MEEETSMKRIWKLLFAAVVLLGSAGIGNAELTVVGTATYQGGNYYILGTSMLLCFTKYPIL
jgi:hypothetical protein